MTSSEETPRERVAALRANGTRQLLGEDAMEWVLREPENDSEPESWTLEALPPAARLLAENGVGDHLFLLPEDQAVYVFFHEGGQIEQYAASIDDILPDRRRLPSDHEPVHYAGTDAVVTLGDRVEVRYWVFFKDRGTVSYVPGVSAKKPAMERDGLAWVRIRLDEKKASSTWSSAAT